MELPVKGFVDPPGSALLVVRHRNFGSVCRSIFLMVSSFWIYFYALFLPLFHALHKSSRCEYLEEALTSSIENQEFTVDEREKSSSMNFAHAEAEVIDMVDCSVSGSEIDGLDKRESPEMFLSFKFPPLPEFTRKNLFNDDLELHSRADFSETEVSCCSGNLVQKMEDSMVEIPEDRYTDKEGDRVIEEDRFSEAELLIESNSSKILDKVHTNHLQFKFKALSEEDLLLSDSHTDSTSSSHDSSIMSRFLDSSSNGFFSDADFRPCSHTRESNIDDDLREELRKLEEDQNTETPHEEAEEEAPESDSLNPAPELESKDSKMELEWEHQYLMEQLRMEIRKVKATGLPTADEHSVSARVVDDLKSWKIDEKFHRGDQILALHKVYRTYCERMRKLDIFNYQKLYALGFLRAKDPLRWVSGEISSSAPSRASLIAQKLRLCREDKRSRHDPITSFARELHRDLETVYVGQLCLSWELLQLQYERALDQCEEDPYSIHRYTEVADEFQMLQVIMQRFLEDEPFEGPRVQHYVKSRCFQRNLLQVPAIREDSVKMRNKVRMEGKGKVGFGVSSHILVEILEESIRVFWQFIRSDKDSTRKGKKPGHSQLQDPAGAEVLAEVETALEKKQKRLKEVLRGGKFILRKFLKQHHHEYYFSDHVIGFFSHVDMRLVRRVLNMSRLSTDQLAWCSAKLGRINFVHRRIHVQPSFILFPC